MYSVIRGNLIIEKLGIMADQILTESGNITHVDIRESPKGSYTILSKGKSSVVMIEIWNHKTGLMYSMDTLTSVLIHELAHVVCPFAGHDKEFYAVEDKLKKIASRIGYVTDEDANELCGI